MKKLLTFIALIFTVMAVTFGQTGDAIVKSTNRFLQTLTPEQLTKARHEFGDTLRYKWTNLPVGLVPREGVRYGDLSDASRIAFQDMLATMLTSQGYLKLGAIMQLDDILNAVTQDAFDKGQMKADMKKMMDDLKWSYENYFISIWGTPDMKEYWGLNLGGHHIALSLTMHGKEFSFTPLFIGTDPAQVPTTRHAGWRPLSKEEDYGFLLLNMMTDNQKTKAIINQAVPKDIITSPGSSQRIDKYYGISGKDLNKDQQGVLKILIEEYLHNFEHVVAHKAYDEIMAKGFDNVYFAWIGSTERHAPHYYIINGTDFLIEYDNVGFQNDGNHIHAILREKDNDFGSDILKDHYLKSAHHKK